MATTRIKIDTRGKSILEMFTANMNEIAAINKLSAGPGDANTYDGNGGEVNITWPRAGHFNITGREPEKYQVYFVREINIPPNLDDSNPASNYLNRSTPLSEEENDTHPSPIEVVNDRWAGKSPRALEYTDNVYGNSSGRGGHHKAGNFLKLKSRKSL